jgi:hypothetical protein
VSENSKAVKKDALGRPNRFSAVTDKAVKEALVNCRGDVLQAAKWLGISTRELDNCLRAIPGITAVIGTIEQVKAQNPEWDKFSGEWFETQCARAMTLYRLSALEELWRLATMDLTENAAMMNVKREAALNLLGRERDGSPVMGELTNFFKTLNEDYHSKRPLVARIRTQLIELQSVALPTTIPETLEAPPRTE